MKNEFKSPYHFKGISDLLTERESKINSLINNLKIGDVKEDTAFSNTTTRIKKAILLTPVDLGEANFVDHEFEEIPLTMQQQLIGGQSRNHYYHQIQYKFTGDNELFTHKPNSFSFSSSDRGIILPDTNSIDVYVDLPELNPTKAIGQARALLSMNIQFVNSNNETVKTWSQSIGQLIDERLTNKRSELIRLFGGK